MLEDGMEADGAGYRGDWLVIWEGGGWCCDACFSLGGSRRGTGNARWTPVVVDSVGGGLVRIRYDECVLGSHPDGHERWVSAAIQQRERSGDRVDAICIRGLAISSEVMCGMRSDWSVP